MRYIPGYQTIERGIRQNKNGQFTAIVTRRDATAKGGSRSYLRCGLPSIDEARAAHKELEAAHPPRRKGRKARALH